MARVATRIHMELDIDIQVPPENPELIRMIRKAIDGIKFPRYLRSRNIRILKQKLGRFHYPNELVKPDKDKFPTINRK